MPCPANVHAATGYEWPTSGYRKLAKFTKLPDRVNTRLTEDEHNSTFTGDMWLNLAAVSLSGEALKDATSLRKLVEKNMTSAQIERAQEMARKCQESNFKHCD